MAVDEAHAGPCEVVQAADARARAGDQPLLPRYEMDERVLARIEPTAERSGRRGRAGQGIGDVEAGKVALTAGERRERLVGPAHHDLQLERARAQGAQRLESQVMA